MELGKAESALALLQNASAIAPKELETHFLLAQVFNQLGRAADAKRHQQFVQEIQTDLDEMQKLNGELLANPRSPDLHHRIAAVYEKLDMPAMASQRRHTAALLARSKTAGKLEPTPSRP